MGSVETDNARSPRRLVQRAYRKIRNIAADLQQRLGLVREAGSDFYDEAFEDVPKYSVGYEDSPYYFLWKELVASIEPEWHVFEIGCGPGQFAEMLSDNGTSAYTGIDISPVAVREARKRVPQFEFHVANAFETSLFETCAYDVCFVLETLEHIKRDREVLQQLPKGTHVIATVPNHRARSHVRWFRSAAAVRRRYGGLFGSMTVTAFESPINPKYVYYVIDGVR